MNINDTTNEVSEAKKLRNDFELKLKTLQDLCEHKETEVMEYQWAPAHSLGSVKVCKRCEKILEHYWPTIISKNAAVKEGEIDAG